MSKSPIFASIFAVATVLLTGCDSASLDWTPVEAPKELRVDTARSVYTIAFAPGAGALNPSEAARLFNYVAAGGIQPADNVTLAVGAMDSKLAESRRNHVTAALRRQGVGATVRIASDTGAGRDRVTIVIERSVVTLPDCPNWSKPPVDHTGAVSSNFGCANVTDLGLMVANPADLLGGRRPGPPESETAIASIQTFRFYQAYGAPPPIKSTSGDTPVMWPGIVGTSGGGTTK